MILDKAIDPIYDHPMERHLDLVRLEKRSHLHHVVNAIHDIKHAFDLQKLELMEYYSHPGNYFPRQFVDYFAI